MSRSYIGIARPKRSTKVSPTALSTVGDIGLSNMSLKIITLSLYSEFQLARLARVLALGGKG